MADPKPMTLCPPSDIDFGDKSAPESPRFGDIYFSTDGGSEETQAVFIKACGLPDAWQDCDIYTIGELGFGTGLNFLEVLQLWKAHPPKNSKAILHFVSAEKYPLDKQQLWTALKSWTGDLTLKMQLCKNWPGRVRGFHRLDLGNVHLTLIHDDVLPALQEIMGHVDCWFLDGFSPSKNPDMWSADVMDEIARLSRPGTRIGTFTVARKIRDGLSEAGFQVEKKKGFGRKRDRLEAVFPGAAKPQCHDAIKPIIIGGGIAGACLAYSFHQRGIKATVIDPQDQTAASGNPAAIIKPRLDLQDRPESRFFLASYLYALKRYQDWRCVLENTVIHRCQNEKEQARYAKLLAQSVLPDGHFQAAVLPHDYRFPEAIIINPQMARKAGLEGAEIIQGKAHQFIDGQLLGDAGEVLATGSHIIWACGFGIRSLEQFSALNLRYSRGQLSWANTPNHFNYSFGGYAIAIDDETLLGATHKRLDEQSPHEARPEDDLENMKKYEDTFGVLPLPGKKPSRSSVRVTTPSTLPMIFGGQNEWGLTGLGSRGFVFAPLLAEALVAKICGEVLPISEKVWTRFQVREKAQTENAP